MMKCSKIILKAYQHPEIDSITDFSNWVMDSYFKVPPQDYPYYKDRFYLDWCFKIDHERNLMIFSADIIDTEDFDYKYDVDEDLKRTLRELHRGEGL